MYLHPLFSQPFVNKSLPSLFFANVTAAKDEKYFEMIINFVKGQVLVKTNHYELLKRCHIPTYEEHTEIVGQGVNNWD